MIGVIGNHQILLRILSIICLVFPLLVSCGGSFQIKNIYDPNTDLEDPEVLGTQRVARPEFVVRDSGNVSAILGKSATLNCRVRAVGNRTVSWIRHKDTHLLTAGRYTYTSDQRFRAIHKLMSQDYLLQILPVKASDNGLYECQVSTTPVMSHYVYLKVAEPHTEILGGPDIYLEEGFTMNLTDRQGKVAIVIDRPLKCDNCLLCPCMTQTMTVECPPGVLAGHVEQSLSILKPTYIIKDAADEDVFVVEGPTSLCSCFKSFCHCCAGRDIIFRIVELKTDRQVGSISKKWNGVLKEVLTKADRFSIDFPPDIG